MFYELVWGGVALGDDVLGIFFARYSKENKICKKVYRKE